MGGNCAITLRTPDGTVYAMDRWTNIIPWAFTNIKFLRKDPEHIKDLLRSWLEMKEDWEKHKETGRYEHNMTEVYAPYPYGIRPSEYGIIVADMVNNEILTHQHYTRIGEFLEVGLSLDEDRLEDALELARQGHIRSSSTWNHDAKKMVTRRLSKEIVIARFEKIKEARAAGRMPPVNTTEYSVSMRPFKIKDYSHVDGGWKKMLEHTKRLGFTIIPEEEADWLKRMIEEE